MPLNILGICGSLRKQSWNLGALKAAQQLCPPGAKLEICTLEGLPLFNQDEEKAANARVAEFKAIETSEEFAGLQQVRWPPSNIADTPEEALARLFRLPGSEYSDPELSWKFAVAPGCNPSTLRAAKELGIPFAPGISTPSDIEIAVEHGCRLLKYFPAETSGGLAHLAAMAAPYAHLKLRYIPLGGLTQANMGDYLKSPLVAALGGSWIAKPDVIAKKDWAAITKAAADAVAAVKASRAK